MSAEKPFGLAPKADRSLLRSFGMALLFVLLALGPELLLTRLFPYPFLFLFLAAVIASAWFGGMLAGFFAVTFSILLVDYLFIPPGTGFVFNAPAVTYLAAFVVCAMVASWVSSAKKKSEEALKETRDQLEIRVSERTAALMQSQAELTHLSRVLSMGELTASIAHEIKQPLTAVVTHADACLEWLSADPPNLQKAQSTAERIIQEGSRAGAVLSRIRALFKKDNPAKDWVDMNEVVTDLMVLLRDEALRRKISLSSELAVDLPEIEADRVQMQQVVLNLVMNGMDAVENIKRPEKTLTLRSRKISDHEISMQIEDNGVGLSPGNADRIFDPFFTTKPQGLGMGLAISRSIVEAHEGRLWAVLRAEGGTIFQFTLPVRSQGSR
jgi:signal transduction histidine kinase